MTYERELRTIPDDELLCRLSDLLRQSRRAEADLVAHIGEVDERRLYAREGSSSMFHYATEVLHLSEAEAYLRIAAARASRAHPVILPMLADGRLHLSGVAKIAPHLNGANRETLLSRAVGKSRRQIEELIAELAPKPDVPATMRKLPVRSAQEAPSSPALQLRPDGVKNEMPPAQLSVVRPITPAPPAPPPVAAVQPLAPARYKVTFTASAELYGKLNRLRSFMRTSVPDGDLAAILEHAVTEKLERLESKRYGKTTAPRKGIEESDTTPDSRYIPTPTRRAVCERDSDQCTFIDARGRRCTAREGLEFHHRSPYGRDGDHRVENLCLMCHAHNAYLAELEYGKDLMDRCRRTAGSVRDHAVSYGVQPPARSERVDAALSSAFANSVRAELKMTFRLAGFVGRPPQRDALGSSRHDDILPPFVCRRRKGSHRSSLMRRPHRGTSRRGTSRMARSSSFLGASSTASSSSSSRRNRSRYSLPIRWR